MRTETAPVVRLVDYRPSDFLIDRVELDVRLHPSETRIKAILSIRPNPAGRADAPLILDGDELRLLDLAVDGTALPPDAFAATPQNLTLFDPPRAPFRLTIETVVDPSANTKLMGLYRSGGVYCTQCEAEGFRRITYFLDRPDVLSVYTTRIEAEAGEAPVLLGNGNPVAAGAIPGTSRHFAVWEDPHPKPAYLFAIVGGRLDRVAEPYRTADGRDAEIAVYVEPGKSERAAFALDALRRSMRWDERVFGRNYDLDVFNVVAVSDFNMGAMENKGLNIFNDKYVLASPQTATDTDYANIEAIIAHEYFHNWTGNRITCRDWFQLCLKEGLTVFRDQEFSADERSRAVQRIGDVRTLRARQFPEDAGPLSHPVRPTEYREINNFYTATVYEKGAEIIRMLKSHIGAADFARGMNLYFERCDGTAATVEEFLACFAEASGRDLSHFARWYAQAGTPRVVVSGTYDAGGRTYRLDLAQSTAPTPGQPLKEPVVIPVALGLVAEDGGRLDAHSPRVRDDGVFVLDRASDSILFSDVASRPVPSVFRGLSAPVRVALDLSDADLLTLLRHDTDPFNRWQAGQSLATRLLVRLAGVSRPDGAEAEGLAQALLAFLRGNAEADPAFAAQVLSLPSEAEIAQEIAADVDPDAIHRARKAVRAHVGGALRGELMRLRDALASSAPYSPDAASAGRRSLRNMALELIAAGDSGAGAGLVAAQYRDADNMTDRLAALAVNAGLPPSAEREALFQDFYDRYRAEPLVLDKWFAIQAAMPEDGTLERVLRLMNDPAFSITNPNRVRSLVGSFALNNATQFHRADGRGYAFLADMVVALDGTNPQVAARLLTAFGTWRTMSAERRQGAEAALRRVASKPDLSPDVSDIVHRSLG
ncbi:aminopeptidase N [Salinarimonas soli]|uniref:Aminopeptidase N n=1 Tax=Salinarimonas soli TaxID=1638099 RepID=A0A5B2VDF5_9HYPH|nr:aminopeptidase N [Salinarimonas soli]KAA2236127.1 aminopeptidase N [Salinarimonas soli]